MRVKMLTLRYAPSIGGFDDRPLADFVRDKEVLAVREHFFTVHDLPHIACLVTYQDPTPELRSETRTATVATGHRRPTQDVLADLSAEDRALFGTLREWRAARSRKDGVPPYVLFTNRELLAIVRARPATLPALQAIQGIGPAKVERHGARILGIVNGTSAAAPASPAGTP